MHRIRAFLLAAAASCLASTSALAFDGVVTSIKPVHSLVAGVMQGAGEPHLLVRGAASPHTYSLRPSDARALESAKLVFWIGPQLEVSLHNAIETLGADAHVIELGNAHGLIKLPLREGGAFEAHEHEGENHGHDAEAAVHDDHEHEEEAEHHDDDDGHGHDDDGHGTFDTHVWLDPHNAAAMVHEIGEVLAHADPDNAELYAANAERLHTRLGELQAEIAVELEPVKDKPFVVFHDAYRYFENRFHVQAAGSITVNPDIMPGAKRLTEIRSHIEELGATCVFAEPQFEPKLIDVATEGTGAGSGVLDPMGAALEDGPDLYFELMRNMAASLKACLSGTN